MNIDALIEQLHAIRNLQPLACTVVIATERPGSIGPASAVEIASIAAGFDWSRGKLLLRPAQPLTELTPEQMADIQASVRKGQSWHAYQAHKKQATRIAELEAEVARLQRLVGGTS